MPTSPSKKTASSKTKRTSGTKSTSARSKTKATSAASTRKKTPPSSSEPKPPLSPSEKTPQVTTAPVATPQAETASSDRKIIMKPPLVVKDLAEKLDLKPFQVVHQLMEMNIFATLTQAIEEDVAKKICEANDFEFEVEKREKGAGLVHAPTKVVAPPQPDPVKIQDMDSRPPVITFMGHVDHGKTSLLDAIRETRVASGEKGGITQHIGAYQIKKNNHWITFLDTPGHEAFTAIRARGAHVTDIAIIVVAANDGIMPQTIEAINHAKAAKVQIMVAINKMDLPGANPDKIKAQLQEHGLSVEDYGGDIICCEVSATKNIGIDNLLESMLLQTEILELKASTKGLSRGIIIEGQTEIGRGPTATALVQSGTLKVGETLLAGSYYGRIKALVNDLGKTITQAGPSTPVKILGLNGVPKPGEEYTVMRNEREARSVAEERSHKARLGKLEKGPAITLENLFAATSKDTKKLLKLVLKADVQGSLEACIDSLKKIQSEKIETEFVHTAVGPISESDVLLAKASGAIVFGFNTKTDHAAAAAAKRESVQIKLYSIIYELIDQVKEAMVGMLDPEERETKIGTALVKQTFRLSKFPVAGCLVENGRIERSARARVVRNKQPIYDGGIHTLKRFQDDASEVRAGMECGIRLGNFNDYMENDIIECYRLEKVKQTL